MSVPVNSQYKPQPSSNSATDSAACDAVIAVGCSGASSLSLGEAGMLLSLADILLTGTVQVGVWLRREEVVVRAGTPWW